MKTRTKKEEEAYFKSLNIKQQTKYCKKNKICCMCYSPRLYILDKKSDEYLCYKCSLNNDTCYSSLNQNLKGGNV